MKNLEFKDPDIENLAKSNNELWNIYVEGKVYPLIPVSEAQIWGPLITTNWKQGSHYNNKCPIDPSTGSRSAVGCVATSTAQIANYWKYPTNMYFNNDDAYVSRGDNGNIRIPEDLDIPFPILNDELDNIYYIGDQTEQAFLCLGIGIKERMNYSSSGSSTNLSSSFYKKLGYGSANSGLWFYKKDDVCIVCIS